MAEAARCDIVKKLDEFHFRQLTEQNAAREALGLTKIAVKIRRCLSCERLFESVENRLCGCSQRREIDHVLGHYPR